MHHFQSRNAAAMGAVLIAFAPMAALAQPTPAAEYPKPGAITAAPAVPAKRVVKVPEGTEMEIEFSEKLSSATAAAGDRFAIVLAEPVKLSDGSVIPAGYSGRGEVVSANKRGFVGKAGELNVRLDYIRVGDDRIRLRASKGAEGKGSLGAAVALTVLFGPLGLLARGANIEIPRGQAMTVFVDSDAELAMPFAAPPPRDD